MRSGTHSLSWRGGTALNEWLQVNHKEVGLPDKTPVIVYFICMDSFYNMSYTTFVALGLGMSFVKHITKLMKCSFGTFA